MIGISTPDDLTHYLADEAAIAAYSTSPATVAELQAAYDAGHWEEFFPPEPEPEPAPPNWSDFRLTLMVDTGFRDWAATLPADWREDLKLAAIATNATALQGIYDHLATYYPPAPAAAAEWQAIATENHISVVFSQVESD
ncbi:hypothetical protein VB780_14075 [Leptolyngbya sp. CCNP1308]|uniref:hypothetical protein n=1 Tax=Leptolyngbya sp. CCNP1308 TaxID=3110255 RepID=UPI002B1F8F0D|nr:hypothetical protein [Leptolyngbya sp. CCNP1308]MEA5449707.1 hypothetical protein [Leptolyngbya sp. CCNP1308]